MRQEKYGQFHVNDSYIVLHVQEADDRLEREIYFWLGEAAARGRLRVDLVRATFSWQSRGI